MTRVTEQQVANAVLFVPDGVAAGCVQENIY